jgi:hypothetical protein
MVFLRPAANLWVQPRPSYGFSHSTIVAVQPGALSLPNLTATRFFAPSSEVARDGIRHNHGKVAEKVVSKGSEVLVANQRGWRGELTSRWESRQATQING